MLLQCFSASVLLQCCFSVASVLLQCFISALLRCFVCGVPPDRLWSTPGSSTSHVEKKSIQGVIPPQAWIKETETELSDSEVPTLPGGFEPATLKSLAWPRATRISGQLPRAMCFICSVGHKRIYAPYMTVYLVIFLPKIPYTHHIWPYTCWFPCLNYRIHTVYICGQPYLFDTLLHPCLAHCFDVSKAQVMVGFKLRQSLFRISNRDLWSFIPKCVLSVFASLPANFIVIMRNVFCLCLLHCLPLSLFLCEMGSVCVCFNTCQFHCSYAKWVLSVFASLPASFIVLMRNGFCLCLLHYLPVSLFLCEWGKQFEVGSDKPTKHSLFSQTITILSEGADWAQKKGVVKMWIEHGRHDWQAPKFT